MSHNKIERVAGRLDGWDPKRDAGVGRSNTRDRLAAMYGDAAKLVVESPPAGGVRVRVRLPLRV